MLSFYVSDITVYYYCYEQYILMVFIRNFIVMMNVNISNILILIHILILIILVLITTTMLVIVLLGVVTNHCYQYYPYSYYEF